MTQYSNIESRDATPGVENDTGRDPGAVLSYETSLYRVEIAHHRSWVYKHNAGAWEEVSGNPYRLPLTHFDLINQRVPLTVAVQTYELATGRFDLRDALTGTNQ